eukprot:scaffold112987_cov28-Tisochrysis_lutea.AAC.1
MKTVLGSSWLISVAIIRGPRQRAARDDICKAAEPLVKSRAPRVTLRIVSSLLSSQSLARPPREEGCLIPLFSLSFSFFLSVIPGQPCGFYIASSFLSALTDGLHPFNKMVWLYRYPAPFSRGERFVASLSLSLSRSLFASPTRFGESRAMLAAPLSKAFTKK